MKPALPHLIFSSLLIFFLASCAPATPLARPTVAATTAPLVPTATSTSTLKPTLTLTLAPTQTPLFPKADGPTHSLGETPTPIDPPSAEASSFRLKEMNEANSAAWVKQMYDYAEGEYAPFIDDEWPKGEFSAALQPAALAIHEHLLHFPNSRDLEQYRWQQLFIYGYSGYRPVGETGSELDSWLISQLQAGLDDGSLTPQSIHALFEPYRFQIELHHSTPNLFGDDRLAWLYQVGPATWQVNKHASLNDEKDRVLFEGLFFVVHEIQPGKYQVHVLHSAWADDSNYFQAFTDHNQNGIPELYLYIGMHSGTMCTGSLLVYEWRESGFTELSQGQIQSFDCADEDILITQNNIPAIQHNGVWADTQFLWDGSVYRWAKPDVGISLDHYKTLIGGNHEENIQVLKELLTTADFTGHGPGLRDYLRFQLAQAYALAGQPQEATREFQALIDSPSDPDHTAFPDFARRFLQNYHAPTDIYRACASVSKVYREMVAPYQYEDLDAFQQETMGILPDQTFSGTYLQFCDENDAVFPLVSAIPSSLKNLPAALKQYGLTLTYTQKLDVNLDEVDEWLFVYRTPYAENTWLLAAPLGNSYHAYEIPEESLPVKPISVLRWESLPNPVLEIQTEEGYSLLEVLPDFETQTLHTEYRTGQVTFLDVDTRPVLQYTYQFPVSEKDKENPPSRPWVSYLWNPQTHSFDIDWFEYQLFTVKDPAPIVKLLPELLSRLERWQTLENTYRPSLARQYYLAALAYELSGDETAAVQTYWQLWHDFPESPYAIMVQFKLEPIP